jgi:RimJ/RimL family protein N-acetyltransferase
MKIIEKPNWVSWDDVRDLLYSAHHANRARGIVMGHQNMTGEEIANMLGEEGRMFVAIVDGKLVGTAALKPKQADFWFGRQLYAYYCFDGVLPEYEGMGLYKQLNKSRGDYVKSLGVDKLMLNTHPNNKRVVEISLRLGYKKVGYTKHKGVPYVYLVKWLDGCPFTNLRCRYEYLKCKFLVLFEYSMKCVFHKLKSILRQ